MGFSVRDRPGLLQRLGDETFDLLIVGGGITGAGIARDAALRGLSVALLERGDFACGTSSRSSKLIHGGLRYLEQGDVGLVFEAVRERQRLIKLAPHLAHPQSFVVPVFSSSRRSVLVLDLGLTIYDVMAAGSGVLRHRAMRRKKLLDVEPLLQPSRLRGGVRYFDAQTNDCRLVMANLRSAHRCGAVCTSRTVFRAPTLEGGKVVGAQVEDRLSGRIFDVSARAVVIATGPFTDEAMATWLQKKPDRTWIRPSKGVHVVVPRARLPLSEAVVMTAGDGRVVFALPWRHVSVLGTTDTPFSGDLSEPRITRSDAQYLLDTANRHFIPPKGKLVVEDVVSGWAGIRPLAIGTRDDDGKTYNTSREHVIETDPRGMVMIAGGKLTTYRVMALEAVEAALKLLPKERTEGLLETPTGHLPLPGADRLPSARNPLQTLVDTVAEEKDVSGSIATHLVHTYGSDAMDVVAECRALEDGFSPVITACPVRWGEVKWVVDEEMPGDLLDLCVRRLPLYYIVGERLLEVADKLAARFCEWAGRPIAEAEEMIAGLRRHIELHRIVDDEVVNDRP